MPVAAGTRIPFAVAAVTALRPVVAQGAATAMRDQVESRVLRGLQAARPEVSPLAQNAVDRRFDAATMNSVQTISQLPTLPLAAELYLFISFNSIY